MPTLKKGPVPEQGHYVGLLVGEGTEPVKSRMDEQTVFIINMKQPGRCIKILMAVCFIRMFQVIVHCGIPPWKSQSGVASPVLKYLKHQ